MLDRVAQPMGCVRELLGLGTSGLAFRRRGHGWTVAYRSVQQHPKPFSHRANCAGPEPSARFRNTWSAALALSRIVPRSAVYRMTYAEAASASGGVGRAHTQLFFPTPARVSHPHLTVGGTGMQFLSSRESARYAALDATGRRIRRGDLKGQLSALLREHRHDRRLRTPDGRKPGRGRAARGARVSDVRAYQRVRVLFAFLSMVKDGGYAPDSLRNLKQKHILRAVEEWRNRGVSAATLANYLSALRFLAELLAKPNLCPGNEILIPELVDARRNARAEERAWAPQDVSVDEILGHIAESDPRVALILRLELTFGLRVTEALRFVPSVDIVPGLHAEGAELHLHRGTKGGRPRKVPIEGVYARTLLTEILQAVHQGSMTPADSTIPAYRRKYYRVLATHGVTRAALGVTSHGLRHQYAQDVAAVARADGVDIKASRLQIAKRLGHGRTSVTMTYMSK